MEICENSIQNTHSILRDGNKLHFTNVLESGTNLNIQNNAIQNGSDTVLMTNAGVIKNPDQWIWTHDRWK